MYREEQIDVDEIIADAYSKVWAKLEYALYDRQKVDFIVRRTIEDVLISYELDVSLYDIKSSFNFDTRTLSIDVKPKESRMYPGCDLIETDGNMRQACDEYREYVYKWLMRKYGTCIGIELTDSVLAKINELDAYNIDTWRTAQIGDHESTKEYNEKRANGCCGFCDYIKYIDGIGYKIGFNYGH